MKNDNDNVTNYNGYVTNDNGYVINYKDFVPNDTIMWQVTKTVTSDKDYVVM